MFTDKSNDDTYVFWYATPAKDARTAFQSLLASWLRAGMTPRQGTPLEITRRVPGAALQVKQHPPPRTPEDAEKIFGEYADAVIDHAEGQTDLYLSGSAVRARFYFEYIGEDELAPPKVDPRRDFMLGILTLPQYWREKGKGYGEGDPDAAASAIEDALADKYLKPISEASAPLTGISGPEHDNVRWRYTEAELRAPIAPRLSDISRYATYLSPAQIDTVGFDHFERLVEVFGWLHQQEARVRPLCRLTSIRGAILSRWPGALDREPRFLAMLTEPQRDSFNRVRLALKPAYP
jgi:hypothetical protein